MKKISGILLAAMVIISCNQGAETNYKVVRDEVMKFHDIVMADHGVIVNNQMKLDTLAKSMDKLKLKFQDMDTLKEKTIIEAMIKDLSKAEDSMNDWMHKFEPDVSGKSDEAAVQYFRDEKVKISAVDQLYKKEIGLSNAYLEKFKK